MKSRLIGLLLTLTMVVVAAPATKAAMISRVGDHDVCVLMASIGHEAAVMPQSGVSQQIAANRMSRLIGGALSNGSGSAVARQRLADIVGEEATNILRLAYSVPVGRNEQERAALVLTAGEYIYGYCMGSLA